MISGSKVPTAGPRIRAAHPVLLAAVLALSLVGLSCSPAKEKATTLPLPPSGKASLSREEVITRFRARASASEIEAYERLIASTDQDLQDKATQMVLFKLTPEELSQIEIKQEDEGGHLYWMLALSRSFADGGEAFTKALDRVGIKPNGFMDLGLAAWYVPREQFFVARKALFKAGLHTNEITIEGPQYAPR